MLDMDIINAAMVRQRSDQDAASAAAANAAIAKKTELNQEDFLTLMITQLKNQDPMKPLDPSQYVGQLAQFSQVSGLADMNKQIDRAERFAARQPGAGRRQPHRPYRHRAGRRDLSTGGRGRRVARPAGPHRRARGRFVGAARDQGFQWRAGEDRRRWTPARVPRHSPGTAPPTPAPRRLPAPTRSKPSPRWATKTSRSRPAWPRAYPAWRSIPGTVDSCCPPTRSVTSP